MVSMLWEYSELATEHGYFLCTKTGFSVML